MEEIRRYYRLYLLWNKVLSEAYSEPSQTFKMERFSKMVNGWILLTFFAKNFILDVWLGSEHVSDYPGIFSIIVKWNYHAQPSKHLFNVISVHQEKTVGKNIHPVTSLRRNCKSGSENFVRQRGEGNYVGNIYCLN